MINQTDNGLDLNFDADPEERKRRLAALSGMITGQKTLGDTAGQMMQDRIGQVNDRIDQASNLVQNPQEELQRRMGVQQTATAPVVPTPTVQQPAVAAPVQQAASPVQQPVVPEQQTQQVQQPTPQVQAPITPEAVNQVNNTQLPQPGPGTQVASNANVAPAPAVMSKDAALQTAQTNPQVTAGAVPGQGTNLDDVYHQSVISARNEEDPQKRRQAYAALLSNESVPEGYKAMANRFIAEDYLKERKKADAEEKIANATPNDLARFMQGKEKEGSYLKAILYSRLGLSELAKEEQQKLGAGTVMGSATLAGGKKYTVERNANGEITRAFNSEGKKASQEEIAQLSSAALPTKAHLLPSTHGAPVQNEKGETGLMMYDPQTDSNYVQVGNERRNTTGWTTMSQNPESVGNAAAAKKKAEITTEGLVPSGENAVQKANRLGLPITSGVRDEAKQKDLYDESVRAGRTGFTATGNPIAKPGTSQHQNANAVDMKLTPEQAKVAEQNGFYRPYANDPNHWELKPTTTKPVAEQKAEIETAAAVKKARGETAAKTIDEKLNQLNEIQYTTQKGLEAINNGKHLFGGGTNSIKRANEKLNPLKEQSDEFRVTADVMRLAQQENLNSLASLLKGSFSDKDLSYVNENRINERSSPAQIKKWLEHYEKAATRAYEQQASSVNEPSKPSPHAPAAPATNKVRKYNPATGNLE